VTNPKTKTAVCRPYGGGNKMSRKALMRLIRVAQIIAKDSKQPENVSRANEIIALAEIIQKEIPHDAD
jgi:hypothetical protein